MTTTTQRTSREDRLKLLPVGQFLTLGDVAQRLGVSRENVRINYLRDACPSWLEIIRDNGRVVGVIRHY